ncbi:G2/mitotic-specific cyclin-A-like [Physella acuta]|uniref:G2/mitotic-specific cyclin-A-like n=1 Tax=Physella acuta TaxID=109671 RepID=UPI0027DAE9A6|nr:G2/mitotic-specific cyclin-A-like [Physella acuta]XP_059157732.1 G2/mitotic-specific cyclin-A-like [Physella acuta]
MSLPLRSNTLRDINLKENQARPKPLQNQRTANTRRPALGNVTNQVRRQPQRIAKDKHTVLHGTKPGFGGQENAGPSNPQKSSGFTIFEDVIPQPTRVSSQNLQVHEPMHDQENLIPEHSLVLRDMVTGLNKNGSHFPALAQRSLEVTGSPMLIDTVKDRDTSEIKQDEFGLEPYFSDIYNYLKAVEPASRPQRDYMNRQTDVSTSMRNILVDWLVEVGEEYKLQRETLFLAINYIDRFLSLVGVHRPKLQLVGTASMFIAAKYEEIYPPDVAEFVYITDDTYTRAQVLKMESVILKLLDFKVAVPTINWFCERFLSLVDMPDKAKSLAFFLTELSLIEVEEFLDYRPSMIAACAIILARSTLKIGEPWPSNIEKHSGYSLNDLKDCVQCLFRLYSRKATMPQQAVIEKYKHEKFHCVSLVDPPAVLAIH